MSLGRSRVAPVVFGAEHGEGLILDVSRWEDEGHFSWVHATLRIRVSGFRAAYDVALGFDELVELSVDLRRLYEDLFGEATFETTERWLSMHIEGDGRGHFQARCVARDMSPSAVELGFGLTFDQTDLAATLRALEDALRAIRD